MSVALGKVSCGLTIPIIDWSSSATLRPAIIVPSYLVYATLSINPSAATNRKAAVTMGFIQPHVEPTPQDISLKGKTAIVTGASAGIGLETCRQLLVLGVTNLYMAVRNVTKGEGVKEMLLADSNVQTNNPTAIVKVLKLDMDEYESVKSFCKTVKAEIPTLDLLILNAGTGNVKYESSPTGHERILQVNYLSNALIVVDLLSHLIQSADKTGSPSRITWVGSRMHRRASFERSPVPEDRGIIQRMDDPKCFSTFDQYSDSKLLALFFMQDVVRRIPEDKVLFNMLCPGMVYSNMADHLSWLVRTLTHFMWYIRGRSTEVGAWIVVNAAAVAGKESNGRFLSDKNIMEPMPFAEKPAGQAMERRLWKETLAEVSKYTTVPEILAS